MGKIPAFLCDHYEICIYIILAIVCFISWLFASVSKKKGQTEGKHPVFCLEGTQTAIALGNGLDAVATIAVPFARGNRQTVPDHYLTCIGILDQHKDIALPDITRKAYPFFCNFRLRSGTKGVFQTVGDHGAKLGVRQGDFLGQQGVYLELYAHSFGFAVIGRAEQIDRLIFAVSLWGNGIQTGYCSFQKFLRLFYFAIGQQSSKLI